MDKVKELGGKGSIPEQVLRCLEQVKEDSEAVDVAATKLGIKLFGKDFSLAAPPPEKEESGAVLSDDFPKDGYFADLVNFLTQVRGTIRHVGADIRKILVQFEYSGAGEYSELGEHSEPDTEE